MGIRNSLIPKIWKNQNMKLLKYNNQMTAQHQFFVFQGVIVCFSDSVYWNHKKNRHEYIEALRKKGHNNKERGSKLWWQLHQSGAFCVCVCVVCVSVFSVCNVHTSSLGYQSLQSGILWANMFVYGGSRKQKTHKPAPVFIFGCAPLIDQVTCSCTQVTMNTKTIHCSQWAWAGYRT